MRPSNEKAAPGEKDGNLEVNQTLTPSLPGEHESLGDLEAALIGYALHVGHLDVLPATEVFLPGSNRALVSLIRHMHEAGDTIGPLAVRLRLDQNPNVTGRALYDALTDAMHHGVTVFHAVALQYRKELEAEHRRRVVAGHLDRATQFLQAARDVEAMNHLRDALTALGGEAA